MSLINDMLKDLDRRGAKDPGSSRPDAGRFVGQGSSRRHASIWLPALGAFALVVGLVLWEQHRKTEADPPVPETGLVKSEQPVLLVPNYYPELLAAMAVPESGAAVEQSEEHSLSAMELVQIDKLLAEAELALNRDRLTSPIEDNAYHRYQEILAMAPEHPDALDGVDRIARRYLDLAERYIDQGQALRAQVLVRRAARVRDDHPDLVEVNRRLDDMSLDQASTLQEPAVVSEQNQGSHLSPGEESHLEVTRDAAFQDEHVARQARELIQQGRHHSARLRLEKRLEEHPGSVKSAVMLLGVYLDQGDNEAARALLDHADYLPGVERARLEARLALARGEQGIAIELLESELAEARDHENYRALLAGLYYRAGRHPEAAASYRRLLDSFGSKPGYWLGLALALDAQDQHHSALESYRRALESGGYEARDQGEVRDYIEQRIATLARQGN